MMSRRSLLATPFALLAASAGQAQPRKMTLAMHQNTSLAAGFQRSLEGWAKAGVFGAEIVAEHLDGFLKANAPAAARRLMSDLGITPVSGACRVAQLWEPHPGNAAALEAFRMRCDQFASVGLTVIYAPTGTTAAFTRDDYKRGADNMRAAGEVARQFGMTAMVEAVRASTFIATLPTLLQVTREAAHPNLKPLLDCYHFWSGHNRLEDLDLIKPGEIGHMHFQDVPDVPRELLDNNSRLIPGDGIAPLNTILTRMAAKGYAGPLSVELFLPQLRDGDPYTVAAEIRRKSEAVMRRAGVL
jgi:sugar phosphate isomerase/epimerase